MSQLIPNSVIGAVASVISQHYYSHSKLTTLFMEAGAPGNEPEGNCEKKCSSWLIRCNQLIPVNALEVLGKVIQYYMDHEPNRYVRDEYTKVIEGRKRINDVLARNQLEYRINGYITPAGAISISKTLEDYLKSGDFSSIETEFQRAVEHIQTDPHTSITAACAIIEATLKFYIEKFNLIKPPKLNVIPLWEVVKQHLPINSDKDLFDDLNKVLKGISSIIDGVGAFRSHIGSAHGRGSNPPSITIAEARLSVNAAHTVVVYIMDVIYAAEK